MRRAAPQTVCEAQNKRRRDPTGQSSAGSTVGYPINRTPGRVSGVESILRGYESRRHFDYGRFGQVHRGGFPAAHHLSASHAFAPALCSCSCVSDNTFIVVAKYIPQSEGTSLHNAPPPPSALEAVRRDVYQAFELHQGEEPCFRWPNLWYLDREGSRPAR